MWQTEEGSNHKLPSQMHMKVVISQTRSIFIKINTHWCGHTYWSLRHSRNIAILVIHFNHQHEHSCKMAHQCYGWPFITTKVSSNNNDTTTIHLQKTQTTILKHRPSALGKDVIFNPPSQSFSSWWCKMAVCNLQNNSYIQSCLLLLSEQHNTDSM